jgi:hypothetical protein
MAAFFATSLHDYLTFLDGNVYQTFFSRILCFRCKSLAVYASSIRYACKLLLSEKFLPSVGPWVAGKYSLRLQFAKYSLSSLLPSLSSLRLS